jgi:ABC-2 type transport system permease protein
MTGLVLRRTGRAEWSRIWSLRASWLVAGAMAVGVVGLGAVIGLDAAGSPPGPPSGASAWDGARVTAMFALFGVLAMAVLNSTSDYSSGGIVPTLQWTPRRGILLVARTAVITAVVAALGVIVVAVAGIVVHAIVPATLLPVREGLEGLGELMFVFAAGALLSVGVGLALRSTAGAGISVIALILVLPLVLGNLPQDWAVDLASVMPGASALYLIVGDGPSEGMTVTSARVTLIVWAAAALAAGGCRLLRTDAGR